MNNSSQLFACVALAITCTACRAAADPPSWTESRVVGLEKRPDVVRRHSDGRVLLVAPTAGTDRGTLQASLVQWNDGVVTAGPIWRGSQCRVIEPVGNTGKYLAFSHTPQEQLFHLINPADGTTELLGHSVHSSWMTVSPDGTKVAYNCMELGFREVSAMRGPIRKLSSGDGGSAFLYWFITSGEEIVAAAESRLQPDSWQLTVVSCTTGQSVRKMAGVMAQPTGGVAIDEQRFATIHTDGSVKMWNPADGTSRWSRDPDPNATPEDRKKAFGIAVALSGDKTLLAVGTSGFGVRVYRVSDGELVSRIPAPAGAIRGVVFNADGTKIATIGNDKTLRIWSAPAAGN